jgi:diacylglycerol kinase
MNQEKFSIKKRLKSFVYAFNGLVLLFKNEHNARIHLFVTVCVIAAGFLFKINILEWIAVIFAIGLVFVAEIINSSIEKLADFVSPDKHENIRIVKDLAAAAVFFAAIIAFIIGLIIFVPYIIKII